MLDAAQPPPELRVLYALHVTPGAPAGAQAGITAPDTCWPKAR